MRKVFKYGTGEPIPVGAIYLTSFVEEKKGLRFVWHYFLVEVGEVVEESRTG